tara:strand:- start:371 stop:1522 length:1152 start_codon:yes stop_codon:yes gene_type:complete
MIILKDRIIKRIILLSVLFLMFIPMIEQKFLFFNHEPLDGSFIRAEKPVFSIDSWFHGNYTQVQEKYLNENFGFRNWFVRLYNQLQYKLYNHANANSVIIGKKKYLYEEDYISAYLGRDFIGDSVIRKKVNKLQKISDTLKTKDIDLIVVLAPGKGSFYPEYIPEKYSPNIKTKTNYEVYKKIMQEHELHILDFHSWFLSMKSLGKHPLFPKTGIHWSKYGEFLAADSLIKYIRSISKKPFHSKFELIKINSGEIILKGDEDIEKGMNLLFDISDLRMGYPEFITKIDSNSNLKALTIADSYYWGMFNFGLSKHFFNNGQFWFYNKEVFPDSYDNPTYVEDISIKKSVENNDIIIILATDANLSKFAFGFIDQLYDEYFPLIQ